MNLNINKVLPFLSLRKKLIIAFSLLSSIPLLTFGIVGLYNNIELMRKIAIENLNHDISIYNERAQNFISEVNKDIYYLTSTAVFKNFLKSNLNSDRKNIAKYYEETTKQIVDFVSSKNIYYQIRYVDSEGTEKFRVQLVDSTFCIINPDSLSEHTFRFYFVYTEKLQPGQLSIVPSELIDKNNRTIPAISFALRLYDDQKNTSAIFIADIFAKELFNTLEKKSTFHYGQEVVIVNNEGYYLYHSGKKKNWNSLLAHKTEENILDRYPEKFSHAIPSGQHGYISDGFDEIISYLPLFFNPLSEGNAYYIIEKVDEKYIFGPSRRFAYISIGFILFFLILSISLGILATNQIALPIRKVKAGAHIIASGDYHHRVEIKTNDEIEELAEQFNVMAAVLNERKKLLEKQQNELEVTVIHRTNELRGEKEKMQVILDNVPSAFILLDDQCRIISASLAIKKLAGINPSAIIGLRCNEALGDELFCSDCILLQQEKIPRVPFVSERKLSISGVQKNIEQIMVPVTLQNDKTALLEILTDITERKRTEQHLLKLEKLVTIGETSALIAHEIRNSLTTVKMLLQLQLESDMNEEEKEALSMALGSLLKMETVVNNLLTFSHGTEFNPQNQQIVKLLEEAIIFIKPQFDERGIKLKTYLENIPQIEIDGNMIREAIINLLLNSVQATKDNGEINITCRAAVTEKNMSDLAYFENTNQTGLNKYSRINIPAGSRVVQIEISDTGEGIHPKNLKKIFDPFFTTKKNGSGLGLAMVKRAINRHNGIIEVQSELNKGTTFTIFIPIKSNTT